MVYVFVWSRKTPCLGVAGEVAPHIFVYGLLQIELKGVSIGPHDHIGADALGAIDISAGIGEADIGRVVGEGDPNLLPCRVNKAGMPRQQFGPREVGSERKCEKANEGAAPCNHMKS